MKILIGNTGLIGSTISEKIKFDYKFNSKNIGNFNDLVSDDCDIYLSCLSATKWLVNQNPKQDLDNIHNIIKILKSKRYNKIYLFSTIDVYIGNIQQGSNEDDYIFFNELSYGSNRLLFEILIKNNLKYNKIKIFRLPALYSKKIKKNILYDLLNNNNVENININTKYQWYNLDNLVNDINYYNKFKYDKEEIINLFTEPLDTTEIIKLFKYNEDIFIKGNPFYYNFKTKLNSSGYIESKENVLEDIKKFINGYWSK